MDGEVLVGGSSRHPIVAFGRRHSTKLKVLAAAVVLIALIAGTIAGVHSANGTRKRQSSHEAVTSEGAGGSPASSSSSSSSSGSSPLAGIPTSQPTTRGYPITVGSASTISGSKVPASGPSVAAGLATTPVSATDVPTVATTTNGDKAAAAGAGGGLSSAVPVIPGVTKAGSSTGSGAVLPTIFEGALAVGAGGDKGFHPVEIGGGTRPPNLASDVDLTVSDAFKKSVVGAKQCSPKDGNELAYAIQESPCTLVMLTPSADYLLPWEITINRFVAVVGHPIHRPIINAHKVRRAFWVVKGGFLDCRFVTIERGRPVEVIPEFLYELRGSAVYIKLGGEATFTGVIFTPHEESLPDFIASRTPWRQVRLLGSNILMEGGLLTLTGCHFWTSKPGIILPPAWVLGGEILILGGVALVSGTTFTANFFMVSFFGAGIIIAALGGVVVCTGVTFTLSVAFAGTGGAGINVFVGGGVGILTACTFEGNLGFFSFFGAGLGTFVGGGVSIVTATAFNNVAVMVAGAGIGFNVCVGGGVSVKTAVVQGGTFVANWFAALGPNTFVGAGTVTYTAVAYYLTAALTSTQVCGASLYVGAGIATITEYAVSILISIHFNVGVGDVTVMAGMLIATDWFVVKTRAIVAVIGQGDAIFIAAGSAVLTNINLYAASALSYFNPKGAAIWVGGPANYTAQHSKYSPDMNQPVYVRMGGELVPFHNGHSNCKFKMNKFTYRDHYVQDLKKPKYASKMITHPDFGKSFKDAGLPTHNTHLDGIYVGKNLSDCSICNVDIASGDDVTGPGADYCKYAPTCGGGGYDGTYNEYKNGGRGGGKEEEEDDSQDNNYDDSSSGDDYNDNNEDNGGGDDEDNSRDNYYSGTVPYQGPPSGQTEFDYAGDIFSVDKSYDDSSSGPSSEYTDFDQRSSEDSSGDNNGDDNGYDDSSSGDDNYDDSSSGPSSGRTDFDRGADDNGEDSYDNNGYDDSSSGPSSGYSDFDQGSGDDSSGDNNGDDNGYDDSSSGDDNYDDSSSGPSSGRTDFDRGADDNGEDSYDNNGYDDSSSGPSSGYSDFDQGSGDDSSGDDNGGGDDSYDDSSSGDDNSYDDSPSEDSPDDSQGYSKSAPASQSKYPSNFYKRDRRQLAGGLLSALTTKTASPTAAAKTAASPTTSSSSSSGSDGDGFDPGSNQGPTSVDRDAALLILDLMAVVTPPVGVGSNETVLNASLAAAAVASVAEALNLTDMNYTFKLVSTEIDPFLRDPMDDAGGDSSEDLGAQCSRQVPLRAYFVSESKNVTKAIRDAMTATKTGPMLQSSLQEKAGKALQVCSFAVTGKMQYFVPGSGSYFPTIGSGSSLPAGSLVPSVLVVSEEDGHLIDFADVGTSYTVRLANIVSGTKVVLSAVAEDGNKTKVGTATNKATSYEWTWKLESGVLTKGLTYYMQATGALGEFLGFSQSFLAD